MPAGHVTCFWMNLRRWRYITLHCVVSNDRMSNEKLTGKYLEGNRRGIS
jgi:hypothetical protein